MYAQVEKPKENKSSAVANSVGQKESTDTEKQSSGFVDNRPESMVQKNLQFMINDSYDRTKRTKDVSAIVKSNIIQREKIANFDSSHLDDIWFTIDSGAGHAIEKHGNLSAIELFNRTENMRWKNERIATAWVTEKDAKNILNDFLKNWDIKNDLSKI